MTAGTRIEAKWIARFFTTQPGNLSRWPAGLVLAFPAAGARPGPRP